MRTFLILLVLAFAGCATVADRCHQVCDALDGESPLDAARTCP